VGISTIQSGYLKWTKLEKVYIENLQKQFIGLCFEDQIWAPASTTVTLIIILWMYREYAADSGSNWTP